MSSKASATFTSHHFFSKPPLTMERAVLLRSITSITSHASIRSFYPSFHRLFSTRYCLHHRSPRRHHISIALPSHIQFSYCLSHISLKSIATSPQFSTGNESLKSVPSLSLHDIPKEPIQIPIEVGDINGVKLLKHDLSTKNVLHCEIVFDMNCMKQELVPLVPLFCRSLLEMGTENQLRELTRFKTKGLSVFPFTSSKRGSDTPLSYIIVRGKAMSAKRYTENLFNLVKCVLKDVQFADQNLFKQFVSQSKAIMENRLRCSGHDIVAARMDAKLNSAGWIREQMGGVSYLEFLKDLEEKVEDDWSAISASLEEIRKTVLSKNNCLVNLTSNEKNLKNSEKYVEEFIDSLPSTSPVASSPSSWNNKRFPSINEAIMIPTQVNYVGKAANVYETGYQLKGSAYVISKLISSTWLSDHVRVSGGAYNGFCDINPYSGIFSFLSYRDPNLLKTPDIYDGTSDFLRQMEMDDDTLTKAIIETIVDDDSYKSPDFKGYNSLLRYLLGITEEERQIRHDEILSTRLSDFQDFANAIDAIKDKGVVVAVASPDDVDAANKERPNFFQVKKAL